MSLLLLNRPARANAVMIFTPDFWKIASFLWPDRSLFVCSQLFSRKVGAQKWWAHSGSDERLFYGAWIPPHPRKGPCCYKTFSSGFYPCPSPSHLRLDGCNKSRWRKKLSVSARSWCLMRWIKRCESWKMPSFLHSAFLCVFFCWGELELVRPAGIGNGTLLSFLLRPAFAN